MVDEKRVASGKKAKAQGSQFELRVRADLEDKGWIVAKWTNNVEFIKAIDEIMSQKMANHYLQCQVDYLTNAVKGAFRGRLVPAKIAYGFNPRLRMRVPLTRSTGFPDFIAFAPPGGLEPIHWDNNKQDEWPEDKIIGVESKLTGELDRAEKDKCKWLLDNNVFSKILIAEKTKVKNKIVIVYHDFKEKYWRFYK